MGSRKIIQWLNPGHITITKLNWVISYNSIFISSRSVIGNSNNYAEHTFSNTGVTLFQPGYGCNSVLFSLGI